MPDSPRQWTVQKNMPNSAAPFDSFLASIVGPNTEPVSVVEVSRLREVEAELERANAALEECARLSGADLSDGFPTWPSLPDFAVQEVKQMREDYDEDPGIPLKQQVVEARVERLEADLQEAKEALAFYAEENNHLAEIRRAPVTDERYAGPSPVKNDRGERARGVLRKGDTDAR